MSVAAAQSRQPKQVSVEQIRQACVDSYATYCQVFQDDGYFDDTHRKLCDWAQWHIQKWEKQVEIKGTCTGKLAFVMPRGSLKSTIVTKHMSVWLTLRRYYKFEDDTLRTLIAGNTHTNSKKKLQGIRGMFDMVNMFKAVFPDVLPKKGRDGNKWSDEAACINRESSFDESTFEIGSLNTKLTGRHYNVILEDDTTAPDADEMEDGMTRPSTETIEKAIGFHQASMPLFVPKGFRLSVVVSTRWAMLDLISNVIDNEHYNVFDVPAEIDGVPVFDCFYDKETLAIIKERVGEYMYSCLYLNKPIDDTLRVFKSTDMRWVDRKNVPRSGAFTISCDPAISEKDEACETAITVNQHVLRHGRERHQFWWEDMHGHFLPKATAEKIVALADKYHTEEVPVKALIVETIAYQEALRYELINIMSERREKGLHTYPIVKAKRGNKEVRIESMQPAFERHRIHFVKGALSDQTESQLLQYPMGKLVDVIDSWSMHNKVWRSDLYKEPVHKPQYNEETTFEEAVAEIKAQKEANRAAAGVGLASITADIGEGLGQTFYYSSRR